MRLDVQSTATVAARFNLDVRDVERVALALNWLPRFFDRVVIDEDDPEGCWDWVGGKAQGYAHMHLDDKSVLVHRLTYTFWKGAIPANYEVDHLCRNRGCVNPAHLEAVTASVNQRRIPRSLSCRNGHERTPENSYLWRGNPICRICRRVHDKNRRGKRT